MFFQPGNLRYRAQLMCTSVAGLPTRYQQATGHRRPGCEVRPAAVFAEAHEKKYSEIYLSASAVRAPYVALCELSNAERCYHLFFFSDVHLCCSGEGVLAPFVTRKTLLL